MSGNRLRGGWKVPPSAAFKRPRAGPAATARSGQRRIGGFAHGSILGFGLDVAGNVAQGWQVLNPRAAALRAISHQHHPKLRVSDSGDD